jgi:replicative DNA helicase
MNTADLRCRWRLINASKPADVITVFEHLQNQGKAEESAGWPT